MKIKLLLTIFVVTSVLCSSVQAADIYCPQTINCDSNGQCDNLPSPLIINPGSKIIAGTYFFMYAQSSTGTDSNPYTYTDCNYVNPTFPQPTSVLEIHYLGRPPANKMQPDTKAANEWVQCTPNSSECENRLTLYCPFIMTPSNS